MNDNERLSALVELRSSKGWEIIKQHIEDYKQMVQRQIDEELMRDEGGMSREELKTLAYRKSIYEEVKDLPGILIQQYDDTESVDLV